MEKATGQMMPVAFYGCFPARARERPARPGNALQGPGTQCLPVMDPGDHRQRVDLRNWPMIFK